jgi:hypothetical protein
VSALAPVMLARHFQGSHALSAAALSARGGVLLDIGRSALAEAWWRIEQRATDPADPLFRALRQPAHPPLAFTVPPAFLLERLRADPALAGYQLDGARVEARVSTLVPSGADPDEGTATVQLDATVRHEGGRLARRLREWRALRVARLTLPSPCDRYALVVLDRKLGVPAAAAARRSVAPEDLASLSAADAQALVAGAARLAPAEWRRRAFFHFEGPGACRRFLEMLDGHAAAGRPVSACVFVDDTSEPLRLRRRSIHGRLVVVSTGRVELADVRLRDPATDLFVVQAERRIEVSGRVEAALIARGGIEVERGARLTGALVLSREPASRDVTGELVSDGSRYRGRASSYGVALAPWSTARDVVAR